MSSKDAWLYRKQKRYNLPTGSLGGDAGWLLQLLLCSGLTPPLTWASGTPSHSRPGQASGKLVCWDIVTELKQSPV